MKDYSIDFLEWVGKNGYYFKTEEGGWFHDEFNSELSTIGLYERFREEADPNFKPLLNEQVGELIIARAEKLIEGDDDDPEIVAARNFFCLGMVEATAFFKMTSDNTTI